MPRIARLVVPGYPHHITQRGNRRQPTFFSRRDYQTYIDLLAEGLVDSGVDVWTYCLMPNHVHLILVPGAPDGLAKLLRDTHARYARRINQVHDWRGHLWQERFHSFVMDERHLLAAARYIELNPVRAQLCRRPEAWPWSSARAHLNDRPDKLLCDQTLRSLVRDWRQYLDQVESKKMIRSLHRHSANGRPAGNDRFIDELEALTGRSLRLKKRGPKSRSKK